MAWIARVSQSLPNFHAITNETNLGTAQSRKLGVDNSCGEYIGFLDADDKVSPETFPLMTHALDTDKSDIVIANYAVFQSQSEIDKIIKKESEYIKLHTFKIDGKTLLRKQLSRINHPFYLRIDWWNKVYRRDLFDSEHFSFPAATRNEGTTSLKMSGIANTASIINQVLFFNRKVSESVSRSFSKSKFEDCITTSIDFMSFLESKGIYGEFEIISCLFLVLSFTS